MSWIVLLRKFIDLDYYLLNIISYEQKYFNLYTKNIKVWLKSKVNKIRVRNLNILRYNAQILYLSGE